MKTLRASEIGTYLYCARAWMYQRKGVPSSRLPEMALGSGAHSLHGRRVASASLMTSLAIALVFAGIFLFIIAFTQLF